MCKQKRFFSADFWKLAFYDVKMHICCARGVENGEKLPRVCPPSFPVGGPGPPGPRWDPQRVQNASKMNQNGIQNGVQNGPRMDGA